MNDTHHEHEDHFFKGLVFGTILGVGIVWFLGTKEGKKFKEELFEKGQALADKAQTKLEENLLETYEKPQE